MVRTTNPILKNTVRSSISGGLISFSTSLSSRAWTFLLAQATCISLTMTRSASSEFGLSLVGFSLTIPMTQMTTVFAQSTKISLPCRPSSTTSTQSRIQSLHQKSTSASGMSTILSTLKPKFRCCWKTVKKEKRGGKDGKRKRNWGCVEFMIATIQQILALSVNSVTVSIAMTTEMARRAGAKCNHSNRRKTAYSPINRGQILDPSVMSHGCRGPR